MRCCVRVIPTRQKCFYGCKLPEQLRLFAAFTNVAAGKVEIKRGKRETDLVSCCWQCSVFHDRLQPVSDSVNRDNRSDLAACIGYDEARDTQEFSRVVERTAARVTRIDFCIRLQIAILIKSAYDAACHC